MSAFLCCVHMCAGRRNVFTYACVYKGYQPIINAFLYCFSHCLESRDLLTFRLAPSSGMAGQQAHSSTLLLLPPCPMSSSYRNPAFGSLFSCAEYPNLGVHTCTESTFISDTSTLSLIESEGFHVCIISPISFQLLGVVEC